MKNVEIKCRRLNILHSLNILFVAIVTYHETLCVHTQIPYKMPLFFLLKKQLSLPAFKIGCMWKTENNYFANLKSRSRQMQERAPHIYFAAVAKVFISAGTAQKIWTLTKAIYFWTHDQRKVGEDEAVAPRDKEIETRIFPNAHPPLEGGSTSSLRDLG